MPYQWPDILSLSFSIAVIFAILIIAASMRFPLGGQHLSVKSSRALVNVPMVTSYMFPFLDHYMTICYNGPLRWIEKMMYVI